MGRYDGITEVATSISKLDFDTSVLLKSLDTVTDAGTSKALLKSLGEAFTTIDTGSLKKIFDQIPDELGGKILKDIPIDNTVTIVKKLPNEDAGKFLSKMENPDAENILKKLPTEQAEGIAKKMGKTWDISTKTLVIGGALIGAAYYIKKKKDAEEKIKKCIDICEPDNWDSHANGSLEKSKLNYSEIKSTRDQPICTVEIDDCGEYCKSKCTEEHDYELPITPLVDEPIDWAKKILNSFNPFSKDGIFGNSGWISVVSSVILVFAIITIIMISVS